MSRSILLNYLVIAFITQLMVAKISEDDKEKLVKKSNNSNVYKDLIPDVLHILNTVPFFNTYKYVSLHNANANIISFNVKNSNIEYFSKIIIESRDSHRLCDVEAVNFYLNGEQILYMNNIIEFDNNRDQTNITKYFYCAAIIEKTYTGISSENLFSVTPQNNIAKNTVKLFILIGKVIQSIAELNFKANILQGNISTQSIQVKKKISNIADYENYSGGGGKLSIHR